MWAFFKRAMIFDSHFKSREMVRPRKRQDSTEATRVSPSMKGVSGAAFLLKSTTIATVFRALSSRLLQLHQLCSHSISCLYADSSPLEMRPTRVVSSANFRSLTDIPPKCSLLAEARTAAAPAAYCSHTTTAMLSSQVEQSYGKCSLPHYIRARSRLLIN